MNTKEQIEMIKSRGLYDFIANYYYKLTPYSLKKLALEMFWQLEQSKGNYEIAEKEFIKVLEEDL